MIRIKSIALQNYRCYEKEFQMEFPENQMILILGKNGAGKSTIFDAMHWCLYGRGLDGKTSSSLINKNIKENMYVKLEIEVNEDIYNIERYYSKDLTTVIIKRNGVNIEKNTVADNNKMIEKLIMPQDIFLSTVLFSQLSRHLLTSGTDKSRKEIFDIILNMEDLINKNEKVKEVINQLNIDLAKLQTGNEEEIIETLMKQKEDLGINNLKSKLTEIDKKLEEFKNLPNLDEYEKMVNLIKENISNIQMKLSQKESEYNQLYSEYQNEINSLKNEYENKKQSLENELNNKYNTKFLKEKENIANENYQKQEEFQTLVNSLYTELSNKDSLISDIKDKISEIDSKLNNIQNSYKNQKLEYEQEIKYKHNLLNNKKQELQRKEKEIKSLMESIKEPIICPNCGFEIKDDSHMENTINDMNKSKNLLMAEINILVNELNNIKIPEKNKELLDQENELNDQKNKLLKQIEFIKEEKQNIQSKIEEVNNQINNIKLSVNNILQKIEQHINQEKINEYNKVMNEINQLFNEKINLIETTYSNKGQILQQEYITFKNELEKLNNEYSKSLQKLQELKILYKNKEELLYNKKYIYEQLNLAKEKEKEILEKIDIQSKKLLERKNKLEEITKDIEMLEFWKEAFGNKGIKNMLLDDIIPYLNDRALYYSNLITNGIFKLTFTSIKELKSGEFREEFDMLIYREGFEDPFEYKELSGGQQRIIDLITMFSLEDLMNHINEFEVNIALYDEIFSVLDEDVRASLTDVFNEKKQKKCIVIISHVELPFDFDDRILIETN
jgi:exonuclease SbcC